MKNAVSKGVTYHMFHFSRSVIIHVHFMAMKTYTIEYWNTHFTLILM